MSSPVLVAAPSWRALSPLLGAAMESLSPLFPGATPPLPSKTVMHKLTPPRFEMHAFETSIPTFSLDASPSAGAADVELDVDIQLDENGMPVSGRISPRFTPKTANTIVPVVFSFDFEPKKPAKEVAKLRSFTRSLAAPAATSSGIAPGPLCETDESDTEPPCKRAKHAHSHVEPDPPTACVNFGTCVPHNTVACAEAEARERAAAFWQMHESRSRRDTVLGSLVRERQLRDTEQQRLADMCASAMPVAVQRAAGPALPKKRARCTARSAKAKATRMTAAPAAMSSRCNPSIANLRKKAVRKSCHQCKSSRALHELSFCATHPNILNHPVEPRRCRKQVCDKCLSKFYRESPAQCADWVCPACRGICSCAACKRQRHLATDTSHDCDGTPI
ncbi:MAG: hypothetical protein MHM6MM_003225 [Cercozoa sp. M6MM]